MKNDKKSMTISSPKWAVPVVIALIAIRAFAPGSEPMSEWSVLSWLLMLAPVLFPLYIFVVCWTGATVGMLACKLALKVIDFYESHRRKRV